jgi:hypothetical protein
MTTDQIILSIIGLLNVGCFIYAASVIKNMGSVISGQKSLIDSMKSYQDILDPEKFKQIVELELRRQKLLIEKDANSKIQEFITKNYQDTVTHFDKKTDGIVSSWNEMTKWITSAIISEFPTYASKTQRNQWIKEKYPLSEKYLVELIDYIQLNTLSKDQVV